MTSQPGGGIDKERSRRLFLDLAEHEPGDPEHTRIRETLIAMHSPLAMYLARRFDHRGATDEDLQQVAAIGLMKAVDRFDPHRGLQFSTFATPTIVGELRRHLRDTGWAVRVPRGIKETRAKVLRAIDELHGTLGRSATPSEIADHLGVPVADVTEALEAADAYSSMPIDSMGSAAGRESRPLAETLGDVDAALNRIDEREALRPLIAALDERERKILMLRFFGEMSQSEIADEVGISQMHVSRLLARTLAELREGMAA